MWPRRMLLRRYCLCTHSSQPGCGSPAACQGLCQAKPVHMHMDLHWAWSLQSLPQVCMFWVWGACHSLWRACSLLCYFCFLCVCVAGKGYFRTTTFWGSGVKLVRWGTAVIAMESIQPRRTCISTVWAAMSVLCCRAQLCSLSGLWGTPAASMQPSWEAWGIALIVREYARAEVRTCTWRFAIPSSCLWWSGAADMDTAERLLQCWLQPNVSTAVWQSGRALPAQ